MRAVLESLRVVNELGEFRSGNLVYACAPEPTMVITGTICGYFAAGARKVGNRSSASNVVLTTLTVT